MRKTTLNAPTSWTASNRASSQGLPVIHLHMEAVLQHLFHRQMLS